MEEKLEILISKLSKKHPNLCFSIFLKGAEWDGIVAKQQLFVKEYLVDLNALRAHRAAVRDNATAVEGHKLLRNPKIAEAVKEVMDKRTERTEITTDMVLLMSQPRRP